MLHKRKHLVAAGLLFQLLAAIFTLVSIPLIIPFFQILFELSPTSYTPPQGIGDLEGFLNYYFSRLIAISDRPTALTVVCWAVILVFLFRNLFRYLASYFLVPPVNGVLHDLRSRLFGAFRKMSMEERNSFKKGQLLSHMSNDIAEIEHGIMKAIELLFRAPLIILGSMAFMIWISPRLAIIAFALMIFIFLVIGGINRRLKSDSAKALTSLDNLQTASEEYLGAKKVMDAFGAGTFFEERFRTANLTHFHQINRILRKRDLSSPSTEFLAIVTVVLLLWYGAHLVFDGSMQASTFFAFIFAFYQIIEPSKTFARELSNVYKASAALERLDQVAGHSRRKSLISSPQECSINAFKDSLEFREVEFSYAGQQRPVLKGLNLKIRAGDHLGIVGLSGAGKTSLIDLLLRFFDPGIGEIFFDHKDIRQYKLNEYRKRFGLVSQDAKLFHGTLKDNILLGREWDQAKFDEALTISGCEFLFMGKQGREHALAGDQGVLLSGGERQRIAIARAIYERPDILILDEPTSALDRKSEYEFKQAMLRAMKGRTAIMISHNTDLLKDMSRIVVLDGGKIVQVGKYDALAKEDGLFRDLIAYQNRKIRD